MFVQDEEHLVVLQREVLRDVAQLAPGEDLIQVVLGAERAMQVLGVRRRLGEAGVVALQEPRREGVRRLHVADAGQSQLLHQPVLQGLIGPLDPALRLAGVGADDVDVQRSQRAAELGQAVAGQRAGLVHPEDGVLVAVERDGAAVSLEVAARRIEVGEGRFGVHEVQVHDPAGGVVDEHQQCAGRPAVLEPAVLRAVDLHQLSGAVPAVARLVQAALPLGPVHPQPGLNHPAPQRLPAERDAVQLRQLLRRQRGPEVRIALAHERQGGVADRFRLAPVRRPATPLGDQPRARLQAGTPSAAGTPAGAQATAARQPPRPSCGPGPRRGSRPAWRAPSRSSPTPP